LGIRRAESGAGERRSSGGESEGDLWTTPPKVDTMTDLERQYIKDIVLEYAKNHRLPIRVVESMGVSYVKAIHDDTGKIMVEIDYYYSPGQQKDVIRVNCAEPIGHNLDLLNCLVFGVPFLLEYHNKEKNDG
jgi:hypothetical protein